MATQVDVNRMALLGVEATPGTPVTPTKRLDALNFTFDPKPTVAQHRAQGTRATNYSWIENEITEVDIEGELCYSSIVYILSNLVSYTAPTVATTVATWGFGIDNTGATDVRKTYTLARGTQSVANANQASFFQFSSLDINIDSKSSKIKAKGFGQQISNGATLGAPSVIPIIKAAHTQFSLFANLSGTTRGGASAIQPLKMDWKIGDRFDPLENINGTATFNDVVEKPLVVDVDLMLQVDTTNLNFLTNLRAQSPVGLFLEATGPNILATATPHSLKFNVPGFVTDIKAFKDEGGVYAFGLSARLNWATGINIVDVVNGVASL